MEKRLFELTHHYVRAFDDRNEELLRDLCSNDITVIDPTNTVIGIEDMMLYIKDEIYNYCGNPVDFTFYATNIIADEEQRFSMIEFILEVIHDGKKFVYRGTDHLYWSKDEKIEKIEAFLYEKN
jgi:hypothetical protein